MGSTINGTRLRLFTCWTCRNVDTSETNSPILVPLPHYKSLVVRHGTCVIFLLQLSLSNWLTFVRFYSFLFIHIIKMSQLTQMWSSLPVVLCLCAWMCAWCLWDEKPFACDPLVQLPEHGNSLFVTVPVFWVENNELHLSEDVIDSLLSCIVRWPGTATPQSPPHPGVRLVCLPWPKDDTVALRRWGCGCPWPDPSPPLLVNATALGL